MKGGEVDAQRLIHLAVQEIANEILPEISGDARYRTRLVLNALKIASAELRDGGGLETLKRSAYANLLPSASADRQDPPALLALIEKGLQSALRAGDRDGDAALYRSLLIVAEARRKLVD